MQPMLCATYATGSMIGAPNEPKDKHLSAFCTRGCAGGCNRTDNWRTRRWKSNSRPRCARRAVRNEAFHSRAQRGTCTFYLIKTAAQQRMIVVAAVSERGA